ncbi:MAG: hypothetical protein QOG16_787 [Actinomycetota bacterium]|jgi:hypothetical protein|nr:hypothetical protein [Actinomycetota bacterium]
MKRVVIGCITVGLLAGAVVAPAEAKKTSKPKKVSRVAEGNYANPALGIPGVVGTSSAGGAVEFPLGSTEGFINVEITDDFGQPVIATMSQDTDPSTPTWEIFATICGKTDEALPVTPGVPIRVSVYTMPGPDQPSCVGPATSGTIKATLSNLP